MLVVLLVVVSTESMHFLSVSDLFYLGVVCSKGQQMKTTKMMKRESLFLRREFRPPQDAPQLLVAPSETEE